jgi:hypothetical protein
MNRIMGWTAAVLLTLLILALTAFGAEPVWPTSWSPEQTRPIGAMETARADENGDPVDTTVVWYEDQTFVRYVGDRPVTVVFDSEKSCPKIWVDASAVAEVQGGRVIRVGEWDPPKWELRAGSSKDCKYAAGNQWSPVKKG